MNISFALDRMVDAADAGLIARSSDANIDATTTDFMRRVVLLIFFAALLVLLLLLPLLHLALICVPSSKYGELQ